MNLANMVLQREQSKVIGSSYYSLVNLNRVLKICDEINICDNTNVFKQILYIKSGNLVWKDDNLPE